MSKRTLHRNIRDWKTSIVGASALIAMLPQNHAVAQLMSINPVVAGYMTIAATVAAGLMLILGAQDPQNAKNAKRNA